MIDKHKFIGRIAKSGEGELVPVTQQEMKYFMLWLNTKEGKGWFERRYPR